MGRGSSKMGGGAGGSANQSGGGKIPAIIQGIVDAVNTPGGRFTDEQKKDIAVALSGNTSVGDSIQITNSRGIHVDTITKTSPTSWKAKGLNMDLRHSDVRDILVDLHGIGSKIKFIMK